MLENQAEAFMRPVVNYAATCLKLTGTFPDGKSAGFLAAKTQTDWCSFSSLLARSISTFIWAAGFLQTR